MTKKNDWARIRERYAADADLMFRMDETEPYIEAAEAGDDSAIVPAAAGCAQVYMYVQAKETEEY